MIALRTALTALGTAAIVLGFLLVPAMLPDPLGAWAGEVLILAGWTAVLAGSSRSLARLRRPVVGISAAITVLLGFALVFKLPGLGDDAPQTLGVVSVFLGLIAFGWLALRGRIGLAPLLAGSLAVVAIYGQATVTLESYLLPGAVRTTASAGELANYGRWVTLTGCAFIAVVIGSRRIER